MKLEEIMKLAVQMGIEKDPRGKAEIKRLLQRNREKYEKLTDKEKQYFDMDSLDNPFPDSRILVGDPKTEVRSALVGVDMEAPEVLLADRLREKGEAVDLIISHHPEGQGLINLDKVMALQADEWYRHGVPINVGEALIGKRMQEIYRAFLPRNVERALDVARLLDIPFMSMHTVADNQVYSYLNDYLGRKKPRTVGEVIDLLLEIPEYQAAARIQAGPVAIVGGNENRAGKIMVDMTGGTEGPQEVLEKLADAGVGTIVAMHYSEKHKDEAEKQKINVIIAGHIVSDSLGMNLILDRLEEKGLRITPVSGLVRVSRARKKTARGKS
ncbi:MAG: NGG1p interacting factor NIF3 [Actinomycetota bacterium]|nr:NGG1p interacting factor NIF3 [Actinomycetota bacterium]MDD5667695.1 NGG1p interacting factor NIF3 [Actinomycetota bacterium]